MVRLSERQRRALVVVCQSGAKQAKVDYYGTGRQATGQIERRFHVSLSPLTSTGVEYGSAQFLTRKEWGSLKKRGLLVELDSLTIGRVARPGEGACGLVRD